MTWWPRRIWLAIRHGAEVPIITTAERPATITRRAALALATAMLAGCGRARDTATVTWWAMSTQGENAPLLLPAFTAASHVPVKVQAIPWTAAHEKVLTAYAGGSLPDVLMIANAWLAELTMLGAVAAVPPDLATGLLPAARAAATVDGRLRGVPWIVDTQVQFYRRDLLAPAGYAAPPADWAGWKAMARDLTRRRPDDFAVLLPLDWPEALMTFAHQQPEPLLRDHASRGNFTSAGFRAAFAFYCSLFAERLAPAVLYGEVGDTISAFERGTFAILPSSGDTVGDLNRRTLPRASWAAAAMPGHAGPAPGLLYGSSLIVTRDASDPLRAWDFVRYLTAPATQQRFHAITGDLPSRSAAWTGRIAADPVAATIGGQLARGVAPPAVPEWARIIVEVQQIAERTVRGEFGRGAASIDAATRLMDRRVDALLAKRRWLLERGRSLPVQGYAA